MIEKKISLSYSLPPFDQGVVALKYSLKPFLYPSVTIAYSIRGVQEKTIIVPYSVKSGLIQKKLDLFYNIREASAIHDDPIIIVRKDKND